MLNADDPNVKAEIPEAILIELRLRYQETTAKMREDLAKDPWVKIHGRWRLASVGRYQRGWNEGER